MAGPLLSVAHVSKSFGGVAAVRDLSIDLPRGEIWGLIGPNGSGKTTLLNLIGGQERPDRGAIRLDGDPITGLVPDVLAARGVARTFQLARVFRSMTVLENLLVPAAADHRRGNRAAAERRARDLLQLVALDALAGSEARVLSGGQAMLLQLARCFAQEPLMLCLLDEPFAGVHPAIKDVMLHAIHEMNRARGVTFLVVSHEMPTLVRLAPRVFVMHDGACIAEGPLDRVASDPRVIDAYLGASGARVAAGRDA
ncbi:MAG TPA: ATP-binding cassette domain-containing protein [bacterium]|nr:ATP-binding cassette domain-containing protein [bacterium]